MPGLAVIIGRGSNATNEQRVRAMVRAMQHEAFYASGTYADEALGLWVGWTCHPGSYCDCLPVTNETGDRVLFFYGEHHGDPDELARLRARGHAYQDDNASALVHLYEERGEDFLRQLNGWYHGVLVDKARREILVFNDRCGMQRLFFGRDGDAVLFASEAKALLRARAQFRALDPRGVGEFLACGTVLENRTLFPGVEALPAASLWSFADAKPRDRRTYFAPADWEGQPPLGEPDIEARLEDLWPRLMDRYTRARLPAAVSLTGGYDTRLIMAYLDPKRTAGVCYTFGGIYRDCFDVKIARKVAATCGLRHEVLPLDAEFFASFPALAEKTVYLADGNLGACNAYELYLNRRARGIAPLKITGSFGSEVMRGSRAFKAVPPRPGFLQPEFQAHAVRAAETFAHNGQGHSLSFSVFRHAPWYYFPRLAVEQSQVVVRTPFLDHDLVGLMYRARLDGADRRPLTVRLIRHGNPALAGMPTDTGNTSWWHYRIMQFLFQADYCYKSGMPQWLEQIHYLLGPFQPERWFIGRHRFQHFRIWFRRQLADYVQAMVLDPRTTGRPYFNRAFLGAMVRRHLRGDRNYTDEIEKVLTIELTHRALVDAA